MTLIGFQNVLRDWWRGFSNEDLASALRKTEADRAKPPGEITWLSPREYKAWLAFTRVHFGMGRR